MQPESGSGSSHPAADNAAQQAPAAASMDWKLLARIVGVAGLVLLALFAFSQTDFFQAWIRTPSLRLNASLSASVLRLFGENAIANGNLLSSPSLALNIYKGCDALEPFGLFVAGVVAFPAGISLQLTGIVGGAVFMLMINQVRIVTLYYAGIYYPSIFEVLHREVWQAVFIALSLVLFLLWMQWTFRMHDRRAPASGSGTG
jgi:exosortase/archaeosortase family protein